MKKPPVATVAAASMLTLAICLAGSPAVAGKPGSWRGQSLTEFTPGESTEFGWQIVNDGVMGGLSKGNFEISEEGVLRFSGRLSLENNGGFSTLRSEGVDLDLSSDLGLLMRVKGDGRTYEARLDSDARFRGMPVSFAGKFETTEGEWTQVKIPFSSFEGSWRGTDLPEAVLNPAKITRLGILLADKQEGPFEVEVDWIRTYGKGQGSAPTVEPKQTSRKADVKPGGLIATAESDGRFSTLKAALDAAGLTTFFQWDNPLTVFAPTDEAFAKLPRETLENLLKPENKEQLVEILSYHVSPGATELADLLEKGEVGTVEGSLIAARFSKGNVRLNDASLIDADVVCADGIIHVIDTVLMPPKSQSPTVVSVAREAGAFSTLLRAVDVAGLTSVLEGEGPFTVFAPTDEAFGKLPEGQVEALLQEENRGLLTDVLKYHVVEGRVTAGEALTAGRAKTLLGEGVDITFGDGKLRVGRATVRSVDVDGGNGIIHIIDEVLLPPVPKKEKGDEATSRGTLEDAKGSIVRAIEKGVPLFNGGDAEGCADLYRETLVGLAANDALDGRVRKVLRAGLERGSHMESSEVLAWHYRRMIDGVFAYLEHSMQ